MKCPNCSLINPETATRCDCGYDFSTQSVMPSFVSVQNTSLRQSRLWGFTLLAISFIAIGPPVGFFAYLVRTVIAEGIGDLTARDFRLAIDLLPAAYWFGLVPALGTVILYEFLRRILPHRITQIWLWRVTLCGAIGAVSTQVYCQISGLNPDLIFWAGLPAGVVCGMLAPISERLKSST